MALAPDLYGGRVAHGADDAMSMMMALPVEQAAVDLGGSVDYLLAHDQVTGAAVGAVGFCMGGGFVLLLGAQQGEKIAGVVCYYGVGPGAPETYDGLTADVLAHCGERDEGYPVEEARVREAQLREEGAGTVQFCYYPRAHAFNNDTDRGGTYDPEAARTSWAITLAFLRDRVEARTGGL